MTELYENLDGFAEEGYHFQLGCDIDGSGEPKVYGYDDEGRLIEDSYVDSLNMNYYSALKPIGTEANPFIGTFDGQGLIIDKAHISGSGLADIGFFGYVQKKASIHDLYLDNLELDLAGAIADGHPNHDGGARVGYLAGHIEDATSFSNAYINNCGIKGRSCLMKNDWGYFGLCENAASIQAFIDKASSQGHLNDWGGSFDSRSVNNWIYNLYKSTKVSNSGTVFEYSTMKADTDSTQVFNTRVFSDFTLKFATNCKTNTYGTNGNYTSYNYYMNPDSFNEPADGISVRNPQQPAMVYQLKDTCYIPLKLNDTGDGTALDNTGFLVGGSYGAATNFLGSPKLSSYYYSSIGNSLQSTGWTVGTAVANKTLGYTDANLEVLTYGSVSGSEGWYRIGDAHNDGNQTINAKLADYPKHHYSELGFGKYETSRDAFQTMCESSRRMHGVHFENVEVSTSNKITVSTAKVKKATYTDYELLKGSIEFNLEHNGHINFFAGTYYTQTKYFNFFSLYKIDRSGNSITDVHRIQEIYLNTASSPKYVYKYSDGTYSEGTPGAMVYDVASTLESDAPVNNALYYFEVPVNEGEYAMGMVPGKASSYTGAYMMYLDIGANAGEGSDEVKLDDFGSVEYRSSPDVSTSSILLITYEQAGSQNLELTVAYDDTRKRYDIGYNNTLSHLYITQLSTEYEIWLNDSLLVDPLTGSPGICTYDV